MDIYFVFNVLLLDSTSLELTHQKRPWCWETLKVGGEGGDRGWDGWMASPTQRTWVWVNSGSWWWTGRPGVLQSIRLQRVRHDWGTELRRYLCRDMHPFYSLGINFWNWNTRSSFQIFICYYCFRSVIKECSLLIILWLHQLCTTSKPFSNHFFFLIFFICSEFCHTLTWKGLGFTCLPHPDPRSHLPPHPLPPGPPRAPGPSACLMHPTWAGNLFHPWQYTCFDAVLLKHPALAFSHRV